MGARKRGSASCLALALSAVACVDSRDSPSVNTSAAPSGELGQSDGGQPLESAGLAVTGLRRERYDDGSVTLTISYRARGSSNDPASLAHEATRVWSLYRGVPEALDVNRIITRRQSDGDSQIPLLFAFDRRPDGTWAQPRVRILPGGSSVVVLSTRTRDDATFVDYLTDLSMTDYCSLAKEVLALWELVRPEVEDRPVNTVFILPTDAPLVGSVTSYSFGRSPAGWRARGACIEKRVD